MAEVDFERFLKDLSSRTGASVESSDISALQQKSPGDIASHMQALEAQYERRGAPTGHRSGDSQSYQSNTGHNQSGADPRVESGYRGTAPATPSLTAEGGPWLDWLRNERNLLRPQTPQAPGIVYVRPGDINYGQGAAPTAASPSGPASFDVEAYQRYQREHPENPLSPFEFMMGRPWTDGQQATPEAIAVYESQGAQWPGARPTAPTPQPAPRVQGAPSQSAPSTPVQLQGQRPQAQQVPAQFSDPIAKWIEQFAQGRAQRLESPPEGSGQNLLESFLRRTSGQFESGGFTPGEQEIYTTQAIDPLERMRTNRKQQVTHELSRRGISPTSGVAVQMIADVDRQFDALRAQTQAGLAGKFADERVARLMQALGMLGNLAGTEEGRLDRAFQYRTVPLNLADRAFSQASGLYNMAGNPLDLVRPLAAMSGMQQGRFDTSQAALADLIWTLTRSRQA